MRRLSYSVLVSVAFAIPAAPLMAIDAAIAPPATDWLLNPAPFKARISEDKDTHQLVLDNGLARRVFQLTPNAACISLENLTSQEHLLRAIAPEARVTLNGVEYAIGGLTGAPVANYLKAAWISGLHPISHSYEFVGWKEDVVKPRFGWKKRPEWLARDLPWPPPGKHVVMTYKPPETPPTGLPVAPVLADDNFSEIDDARLNPTWTVIAAPGLDRASFNNEGKVGEIMAWADSAVCAEHEWPAQAQSVEVWMDSGDDRSSTWGSGLAVMVDGRAVNFTVNPRAGTYSVAGKQGGKYAASRPCGLRVSHAGGELVFEATQQTRTGGLTPFTRLGSVPCAKSPQALRVGKVGLDGSGKDAGADKTVVRCHVLQVRFLGEPKVAAPTAVASLPQVEVHYELYDGIPLFSKWVVIRNNSKEKIRVNRFTAEELRLAEADSYVSPKNGFEHYNLSVETDYSFGGMPSLLANQAVQMKEDPSYPTQVDYGRHTPCLLTATPPEMGPDVDVAPGESFDSFRVFNLLLDSGDRERRALAHRRMYRTVAPWTAENPFMFHKTQSDPKTVRNAIDQAAEVGFDMVIMSFGSGFNFESRNEDYMAKYRALAEYGKSKGVVLGGYSLLASRGAGNPKDNTRGSRAKFGVMPCLGSTWGRDYLVQIRRMCEKAGLGAFENDGSYPGDRCAAQDHPFHHGLEDSQWVQWRGITDLYQWCTANGVYLNIPDCYFLSGATKTGMGYRETNWSLPRAEQEIIERQNMFDGTWDKTASMGWMFVPLSQYHGGGAAATIEPLHQHLPHYEARFANLLGYGAQACYRGPRLYDTAETKALVKKWVNFYKTHREVLDSDIIHLRRPNGQDWDGIVHVNPQGREKAMAFFYNPLTAEMKRDIRVPLYYAGFVNKAQVSIGGAVAQTMALDKSQSVTVKVTIPAGGHQWVLFTE